MEKWIAFLDVIWFPDIGEILLGDGGMGTWFRVSILVALVVGVTFKALRRMQKEKEDEET